MVFWRLTQVILLALGLSCGSAQSAPKIPSDWLNSPHGVLHAYQMMQGLGFPVKLGELSKLFEAHLKVEQKILSDDQSAGQLKLRSPLLDIRIQLEGGEGESTVTTISKDQLEKLKEFGVQTKAKLMASQNAPKADAEAPFPFWLALVVDSQTDLKTLSEIAPKLGPALIEDALLMMSLEYRSVDELIALADLDVAAARIQGFMGDRPDRELSRKVAGRLSAMLKPMLEQKTVQGKPIDLTLIEVPPSVSIARGWVGSDCSSDGSCHFTYASRERVWIVMDAQGLPRGYVQASQVNVEGRPVLYINCINGVRISSQMARAIIQGLQNVKKQLRVSALGIPQGSILEELINFPEIESVFQDLIKRSPESAKIEFLDLKARKFLKKTKSEFHQYDYDHHKRHRTLKLVAEPAFKERILGPISTTTSTQSLSRFYQDPRELLLELSTDPHTSPMTDAVRNSLIALYAEAESVLRELPAALTNPEGLTVNDFELRLQTILGSEKHGPLPALSSRLIGHTAASGYFKCPDLLGGGPTGALPDVIFKLDATPVDAHFIANRDEFLANPKLKGWLLGLLRKGDKRAWHLLGEFIKTPFPPQFRPLQREFFEIRLGLERDIRTPQDYWRVSNFDNYFLRLLEFAGKAPWNEAQERFVDWIYRVGLAGTSPDPTPFMNLLALLQKRGDPRATDPKILKFIRTLEINRVTRFAEGDRWSGLDENLVHVGFGKFTSQYYSHLLANRALLSAAHAQMIADLPGILEEIESARQGFNPAANKAANEALARWIWQYAELGGSIDGMTPHAVRLLWYGALTANPGFLEAIEHWMDLWPELRPPLLKKLTTTLKEFQASRGLSSVRVPQEVVAKIQDLKLKYRGGQMSAQAESVSCGGGIY